MTTPTIMPPPAKAVKKSTTVKETEAAPVSAGTASKPEILGVQTKTLRPHKHSTPSQDVNTPSDHADGEATDQEAEPDPAQVAELATKIERELAKQKEALTEEERKDLEQLKSVVKKGLDGAILANEALRNIRDRRLWRETHESFDAFCRDEVDLSEGRVSQLFQSAEEIAELQGKVSEELIPKSERGIRALRRVKKPNRVKVLLLAAELSNGDRPNSASIEQARIEIEGEPTKKAKADGVKPEAALKAASVFQKFVSECDVKDLTGHEIEELRTAIGGIMMEAEKLGTKAA